jgi:AraC family transcriptional regulator
MQPIRIIEIPDGKMVSSGIGMFGQEKFDKFHAWLSSLPRTMHPKDFLFWDGKEYGVDGGFHWLYMYEENMTVPAGFGLIDFTGGLYAVATDIDGKTDIQAMDAAVDEFLLANGFERDHSRPRLGHIITPPAAHDVLGYHQMDYYAPVKKKFA